MSHEPSSLFVRLAPVLTCATSPAERAFYEKLGLPVIYEGPEYPEYPEYPEFIAFGTDSVHLGIQKAQAANDPPARLFPLDLQDRACNSVHDQHSQQPASDLTAACVTSARSGRRGTP